MYFGTPVLAFPLLIRVWTTEREVWEDTLGTVMAKEVPSSPLSLSGIDSSPASEGLHEYLLPCLSLTGNAETVLTTHRGRKHAASACHIPYTEKGGASPVPGIGCVILNRSWLTHSMSSQSWRDPHVT